MHRILSFGELVWDDMGDTQYIGGAPFNFAAHCAQLGNKACLMTAVGNDEAGNRSITEIRKYGIDTEMLQIAEGQNTGITTVQQTSNGPAYSLPSETAFDHIRYADQIEQQIEHFHPECLYFGSVAQRNGISASALEAILQKHSFPVVFCDINLRAGSIQHSAICRCLTSCSVFKMNRDELSYLIQGGWVDASETIEDCLVRMAQCYPNCQIILLTLDMDGAIGYDCKANRFCKIPGSNHSIVSTIGAGDAFSAGFCCSWLEKHSLEEALEAGSHLAGLVLQYPEAVPLLKKVY